MTIYLLKMIACSAAFYGLYHFLFQKEKMLVFNRFYLLGSLIVSFFIPLITYTVEVPVAPEPIIAATNSATDTLPISQTTSTTTSLEEYFLYAVIILCISISLSLLVRFIRNLIHIYQLSSKNENCAFNNARLVLLNSDTEPHSFFNTIFLNKRDYKNGSISSEILIHEMAHIRLKHSWDIVFIEILQVFTWFNPMLILYKRSIKINHEYQADEAVVRHTQDSLTYQQLLLNTAYINNYIPLASNFYFTTKKRLIMLQKTFKKRRAIFSTLALVPITAVLLLAFIQKKVVPPKESKNVTQFATKDTTPSKTLVTITADSTSGNQIQLPKEVYSLAAYSKDNRLTMAELTYKSGKKIVEDISTVNKQKDFEKKYGISLNTSKRVMDTVNAENVTTYNIGVNPPKIIKSDITKTNEVTIDAIK